MSPGTQFRFTVLFQSDVPLPVLVFAGEVGVVVVLLQLLQEVTFVCHSGLRAITADGLFCFSSTWFIVYGVQVSAFTHRGVQSPFVVHSQIPTGLCASDDHNTSVNSFKL